MNKFSIQLNKILNETNTTKYRLAKILNCSKQSVCNWCDGKSEPTISYLEQIANYFNVSADYLLGLENDDGSRIESSYEFEYQHNNTILKHKEKKT